jgi:ATP-dependent exoDNAse (exonuclease V) alpha subunit
LYLKGISSGEMGAALEVLVGSQAKGLSASTVSRLKQVWAQEYRDWCEERLDQERWVYDMGGRGLQRSEGGAHEAVLSGW